MAQPLVRECVRWRVDRPTLGSRLWRGTLVVLWVLSLVPMLLISLLSIFSTSPSFDPDFFDPPRRRDPRMPDPAGEMPLARARLTGHAPWLPPGGVRRLRLTTSSASCWGSIGSTPVTLPLDQLHVVSTEGSSFAANAPWVVRLTGPGTDLSLRGTRLTLAWIAQLGGWPADR